MECPDCGSIVTIEMGADHPVGASIEDVVIRAESNEQFEVHRQCWECGWSETRRLRLEAVEESGGDETVIAREDLVDEITSELEEINEVSTLAAIRKTIRQERDTAERGDPG